MSKKSSPVVETQAVDSFRGAPMSMQGMEQEVMDMELSNEEIGWIDLQKKDKFEKFYVRSEEDYVFQVENLPEAFAKLEEEEPQSLEKQRQKEILQKDKNPKQLLLEKFISPAYTEFDTETGYFDLLNSSFKSSGDEI